ncbi:MAG TPA: AI-2E family transporter [Bacteroidales bacterium]|nr:AI-2E family transporter [Bacteroidales bacterium]HNS46406.1 AI-2E family transporter [Bacteroidales bacterium]
MNRVFNLIVTLLGIGIVVFLFWRFSDVLTFILISAVLSFIGHPLVRLLDKISIGHFKMPHVLSTVLTLIALILVIVTFFYLFIPLVIKQLDVLASIDYEQLQVSLEKPLSRIQDLLVRLKVIAPDENIVTLVVSQFQSVFSFKSMTNVFSDIMGLTSTVLIGVFSIIFMTFFFLKDDHLFFDGIMLLTPSKYKEKTSKSLTSIRELLSRYFIGLMIEMIFMISMLSLVLTIFGIRNAFLIAFLGGLLNVIPYLGPFIAGLLGVLIAVSTSVNLGDYNALFTIALKVVGTFVVIKGIDDMVLQPWIYSRSVRAHPLEIFIVILVAGSLAGVIGMILAIPGYTVLRIVAKQFLSHFEVVQNITKGI